MPEIPSPENLDHHDRPRGVTTVPARLVVTEGGRPVGVDGHQFGTEATVPGTDHETADVVSPQEPHGVRRHRLHGVLVQQADQLVDVEALKGVDVPGQQLALAGVHHGLARAGVECGQRGPGALQGAVHRGHARVEQFSHLRGLPPQYLAQDQGGPLARRQVLQGGDERQADGLAFLGQLGGVGFEREDPVVGDGGDP